MASVPTVSGRSVAITFKLTKLCTEAETLQRVWVTLGIQMQNGGGSWKTQ